MENKHSNFFLKVYDLIYCKEKNCYYIIMDYCKRNNLKYNLDVNPK
jgi:hypothetical protein